MFSITVALANTQIVWTFMYKTKESAEMSWHLCTEDDLNSKRGATLNVVDDFGQSAVIPSDKIAGMLLEDLDQSKLAHIERSLHIERVKVQASRAAQADPMLKTAMMTRNGSAAVFDPTR